MLIAALPGDKDPDSEADDDADDHVDDEAETGEFVPRPIVDGDGVVDDDDPADNEKTNRVGSNRPS